LGSICGRRVCRFKAVAPKRTPTGGMRTSFKPKECVWSWGRCDSASPPPGIGDHRTHTESTPLCVSWADVLCSHFEARALFRSSPVGGRNLGPENARCAHVSRNPFEGCIGVTTGTSTKLNGRAAPEPVRSTKPWEAASPAPTNEPGVIPTLSRAAGCGPKDDS
jgi:hypothetical protein